MTPPVLARIKARVAAGRGQANSVLRGARSRWPVVDHLVRAYARYQDRRGDRLAAAVTFFGFLSLFPLLALAYAILGYLAAAGPDIRDDLARAIHTALPEVGGALPVSQIARAKEGSGLFGLVGLLLTGLGWVDALRQALRDIWLQPRGGGNLVVRKLGDVAVLLVLGGGLIASVAVSSSATSTTTLVLRRLHLLHAPGAGIAVRLLAVAVAVTVDTGVYLAIFSRLSGTRQSRRSLLRGALLAAAGFEVLKLAGTYLVGRTARNPVYASFAVVVGLLVWINVVARFTFFAAAWTATSLAAPPPVPDMVPIPLSSWKIGRPAGPRRRPGPPRSTGGPTGPAPHGRPAPPEPPAEGGAP